MAVTARAFFYIQQVELLARRRIEQGLQDEAITAGQYMVLNLIVHHEPVSSADLARRANMTAQSMGEFIKAMETKGLLERRSDPNNRRVIQVSSTAAGRAALVQAEAKVDQIEREYFGCLTVEELAQLKMLLNRVRTAELARLSG
ncbi:MAG: MarR family transcriptional regulator [Burkholderiaceae bacterium]|nr:MarR family transcriptional regulator [Burkholderiaceae bacterium]